jgi:hypothetical protein
MGEVMKCRIFGHAQAANETTWPVAMWAAWGIRLEGAEDDQVVRAGS